MRSPGMAERGLSLDRWPVGTGPYMMTEFEQDRRHVMVRNPNYRGEPYPATACRATARPGCWTTAARPCPSSTAWWWWIARRVQRKNKFRRASTTCPSSSAPTPAWNYRCRHARLEEVRSEYERKGFASQRYADVNSYIRRLQHARPGGRPRRADAAGQERNAQAAPGDLDRHRLGRVLRSSQEGVAARR
jgi:hypothetical protein